MVSYKCRRCGKLFEHRGDYKRHTTRRYPCKKSSPKPKLKCDHCGKTYSRIDSLKRHMLDYCENINQKKYKRSSSLDKFSSLITEI